MLEQMQRQRARAIEQQDIALLQVVEFSHHKILDERIELATDIGWKQPLALDHRAAFRRGRLQFRSRIAQQRRESFEGPGHHTTSIGVFAFVRVANRLVSVVPPEQPLPNEKSHEPRRS